MEKFTYLYIDEDHLGSFPTDLPPTLVELRVNNNSISQVSEWALAQCKNLKVLNLDSNRLTDKFIPTGAFHSFKSLHIIKMNFNCLNSGPSNLRVTLKELYLEANKILVIPNDVFSEQSEVEKLNLSQNIIINKGIKRKTFYNMIRLESLNLANNLLITVPKDLPKSLKKNNT